MESGETRPNGTKLRESANTPRLMIRVRELILLFQRHAAMDKMRYTAKQLGCASARQNVRAEKSEDGDGSQYIHTPCCRKSDF